ncbi:MAG: hypothetical protein ACRDBG_18830, partial [Waterburya sp.]
MKKYPSIRLPKLANIEAEKGEVIVNPDGVTFAIDGQPHSKGGTDILAEYGSKVYSKKLKLPKGVVYSLNGKDEKESPSKLVRRTDSFAEILEDADFYRHDGLRRKTATLMFEKNKAYNETVFQAQEEFKRGKGMKNSSTMAQSGTLIPDPLSDIDYFNLQEGIPFLLPQQRTKVGQNPFSFENTKNFAVSDQRSLGMSYADKDNRYFTFRPFADSEYFKTDLQKKRGEKLTPADKEILRRRQEELSNLRTLYPNYGQQLDREFAKFQKKSDLLEKDKFLKKE